MADQKTITTDSGGKFRYYPSPSEAEKEWGLSLFDPAAGDNIYDAAKEAVELAIKYEQNVALRFNGIDICCDSGSDPIMIANTYHDICKMSRRCLTKK